MLTRHFPLALIPLSLLLLEGSALAQQRSPGFAISRFNPSERGSDWFTAESLDLRGSNRVAVGVVADYSHDPLAIYDSVSGDQVSAVISNQIYAHFGISYIVAERLRLSLDMPVLLLQQGTPNIVGGELLQADHGANAGDLRIGADFRLFGEYGGPITAAIGGQLYAPTGKRDAYAGDGAARFAPRALIAGQIGPFVYAGRFEVVIRKDHPRFDNNSEGDEGYFAAAAGIKVGPVVVGPELAGSTVLSSDAFEKTTTPVELILGTHIRVGDFKLGAGFGPGLSRGVGEPDSRWLLALEWFPEPTPEAKPEPTPNPDVLPEADIDHDGIANAVDACPEKAGIANSDPAKNGCPVLDRDNDGVPDEVDACPNEAGEASGDPKTNGCPPPKDADKDGIPDGTDACPNEAGVATSDPKTNGCPAPKDSDADGIPDPEDACPTVAGVKTTDSKTNGCPAAAHIEQNEIRILEPVKFAKNSDAILPESEPVLSSVMEVLQGHPEITKLEVRGHTDSRGGAGSNLMLSKKRAASVRTWLINHGISATRLTSEGYGQTRPIDSNDTEEGRRNNRRVEFRITETAPQ